VLGATCSALIDAESRPTEKWGLLLGAALLGVGTAMRLGQSSLSVMFLMGLTLSILSRGRAELRGMLTLTERPVMLPALVLAGASVSWPRAMPFGIVLAVALAGRLLAKMVTGYALKSFEAPSVSRNFGLALLPSGILSIMIGLSCKLRFPGLVGDAILAIAAGSTIFGELIGPAMLRRELLVAHEIAEPVSTRPPEVDVAPRTSFAPGRRSFVPTRPRARVTSHPSHPSRPSRPSDGQGTARSKP
jgi:hypothetical protein